MKGGSVEFKFTGDTSDVEKKASGLNKKLEGIAKVGASGLISLGGVATSVLVKATTEAVKSQGELEQQIGGTEAVFGKFAKTVQTQGANAFDKMGLSANEYMQYMNKMGSLMQGSGLSVEKSMDLSNKAMQRASDVASIMGIDVSSAMEAIAGASKGNFTMMDNLGVSMNATSLQAYALEKGLKKSYNQMSQGEKVELAMQMFLEKSAYATGNYTKENKTFAGSLNTLKASVQNLLNGTGNVDQVLKQIQNFGTILAQNLIKILPQVVQGLIGLINGLIPILTQMMPTLINQLLPIFITGVTQLTLGIINALPDLIIMIADILPTLMPQIVDAIMTIIPALIKQLPKFVKAGWQLIKGLIKGIWEMRLKLLEKVIELGSNVITKIKETLSFENLKSIGKDLVKGLWNGINNAKDWVLDKVKGFGKAVLKGIKKIFGVSSPSKEFEIIGRYNVMGLEEGMAKESLKLQDSFDKMFSLSPNLYGTASTNLSPQVNVINNITMKQDNLGQMVNSIKTFSGGAKNDYSYGMGA